MSGAGKQCCRPIVQVPGGPGAATGPGPLLYSSAIMPSGKGARRQGRAQEDGARPRRGTPGRAPQGTGDSECPEQVAVSVGQGLWPLAGCRKGSVKVKRSLEASEVGLKARGLRQCVDGREGGVAVVSRSLEEWVATENGCDTVSKIPWRCG